MTDLHIHTYYSDGTDTCAELFENLKKTGIDTFAITDHDNLGGVFEMQRLLADKKAGGIRLIPGVEISSIYEGTEIHLLAYGFGTDNKGILQILKRAEEHRREKLLYTLEYVKRVHGIEFSEKETAWLKGLNLAGKPHIARLLINRGLAGNTQEAILRYLDACKAPELKIEAAEAIAAVKSADGAVSLAHPKEIMREYNRDFDFVDALCKKLKNAGLDALEVYHSTHTAKEYAEYKNIAAKYKLLISGGSDYHGALKTVKLGQLCAEGKVDGKELTILSRLI